MQIPDIILASSSQTRKDLMDRLKLSYRCISPDIDESPQGESHADDLAQRLAFEKRVSSRSNFLMRSSSALIKWLGENTHHNALSENL